MGTTADMDANSTDHASVELCESWSLSFDQMDASTYMPFGAAVEFGSAVEVTTSSWAGGFSKLEIDPGASHPARTESSEDDRIRVPGDAELE